MSTTPTEAKPSAAPRRTNRKSTPPPRIVIQYPTPAVDGGRYPAKRCVGDTVTVEADIFRDGHDLLRAVVRYKGPGDEDYRESDMERIDAHLGGVRWAGSFDVDRQGRWEYTVEAWTDVFGTWRDELERKVAAQQHNLAGEISEGVLLLKAATKAATDDGRQGADRPCGLRRSPTPRSPRRRSTTSPSAPSCSPPSSGSSRATAASPSRAPITIEVDRLRARFSSWYELFPRSWGGLVGVKAQLPRLAELGFDILYLPPIHPIGLTNRKGANNSLTAGPPTRAPRGRSATRPAATRPCTPTWERSRS